MTRPQNISRLTDKIIPNNLKTNIFLYFDNFLIVSNNFNRHIEVLKLIVKRFREPRLTNDVGKSQFFMEEIKYLGPLIGKELIKTDLEKFL